MNKTNWHSVGTALLGSWPSQVASWGREAIAAYFAELEARGVTPDQALVAIRSCPGDQKFPPSAPEMASLAHRDPSRPTWEEAYRMIYSPGGVFGIKRTGSVVSPWVLAFVDSYGRERMRMLEVDHEDYGAIKRRDLHQAWDRFIEASEGRELAAIARGRRGELGHLDPLAALGVNGPMTNLSTQEPT